MPQGEGKLYTRFYRDPAVMNEVANIALFNAAKACVLDGSDKVRVWCCGCSSGEEVYSLKFLWKDVLEEHFSPHVSLEIVGTDISENQLAGCRSARYLSTGMGTLPRSWRGKYLVRDGDTKETLVGTSLADTSIQANQCHSPAEDAGGGGTNGVSPGSDANTSGTTAPRTEIARPEIGLPVICSRRAPDKVKRTFQQHSSDGTGTICEIYAGRCRVAFESGHLQWCLCGKEGHFHLAVSSLTVRRDLQTNISFAYQDVREGVPDGPFHVVLCRYSAFLYLSGEENHAALCAIVAALAPSGFLVIGECEMLPDHPLAASLSRDPKCPYIFRKDARAGDGEGWGSRQGDGRHRAERCEEREERTSRPALAHPCAGAYQRREEHADKRSRKDAQAPDVMCYDSLNELLHEQFGNQTVESLLGRSPWHHTQRRFLSDTSAKIFEKSDRPKGPVLQRLENVEQARRNAASAMDSLIESLAPSPLRVPVRKAAYSPSLMSVMQAKLDDLERRRVAAHKTMPAVRLEAFVARMARDSAQREERRSEWRRQVSSCEHGDKLRRPASSTGTRTRRIGQRPATAAASSARLASLAQPASRRLRVAPDQHSEIAKRPCPAKSAVRHSM